MKVLDEKGNPVPRKIGAGRQDGALGTFDELRGIKMANVLQWNEIYQEIEELVGIEGTLKFHHRFAGETIAFPISLIKHENIVKNVRTEYQYGATVQQLAKKYQVTVRTIERYVKGTQ